MRVDNGVKESAKKTFVKRADAQKGNLKLECLDISTHDVYDTASLSAEAKLPTQSSVDSS